MGFFSPWCFVAVWVSAARGWESSWGNGLTIAGKRTANEVMPALQNTLTGRRKSLLSAGFIYCNHNCLDFVEERNEFVVGSFPALCLFVVVVSALKEFPSCLSVVLEVLWCLRALLHCSDLG